MGVRFKHAPGSWENSTGFQKRFLGQNIVKNLEITFSYINKELKYFRNFGVNIRNICCEIVTRLQKNY